MNEDKKKVATYVLVSGGHAFECLALAERLKPHLQSSYIVLGGDPIARSRIPDGEPVVELRNSFQEVRRKSLWRVCLDAPCFAIAFLQSIGALRKLHTDVLVSTGSGPALAPMLAAKILGKQVVFVESATRVTTLSLCGAAAYYYLADLFFVQWDELRELYPRAIYAGRLF
jgi:UDP-N-acetylglucosamine:LPS N-acetylglucosamine transferase